MSPSVFVYPPQGGNGVPQSDDEKHDQKAEIWQRPFSVQNWWCFSVVLFHNLSFSILKVRCHFWWGRLILALASRMASEEVVVTVNHFFTAETILDPEMETGLAFSISTTCGVT